METVNLHPHYFRETLSRITYGDSPTWVEVKTIAGKSIQGYLLRQDYDSFYIEELPGKPFTPLSVYNIESVCLPSQAIKYTKQKYLVIEGQKLELNYFDAFIKFGDWHGSAEYAKKSAPALGVSTYFFNGVICYVHSKTDLELLWRDLKTAYLLDWKEIGPNPVQEYPEEIKNQAIEAEKLNEKKREELRKKYENETRQARDIVSLVSKSYPFRVYKDLKKEYEDWFEVNSDSVSYNDRYDFDQLTYHTACFMWAEYTASFALYMSGGNNLTKECFESAIQVASDAIGGGTGFQFGVVKQILSKYWLGSDVFRSVYLDEN